MPTTTNFGWTTPADTDLVKDGALAIRTLGNGVDTSFLDLKGGATGDSLVKASATDLDYNWTRLADQVLANPVINGGMDIWQRGTSAAITSSTTTYLADRWAGYRTATGATVSRQNTNDTTNVPTIQFSARVQRDSGNTSTATISYFNIFESVNTRPFIGRTVTLSFYAKAGANYSQASSGLTAVLKTGTGTDQNPYSGFTGNANPILQTATLTTSWQRFAYSATLGTGITQIATGFEFTPVGTAGANDWFEVTGVQLDVGTFTAANAPAFRRSGGTIQGELAACQRYYIRQTVAAAGDRLGSGHNSTTTLTEICIPFAVRMRTAPTALEQTGTAGDYSVRSANVNTTASAVPTFQTATTDFGYVQLTVASGLTAGSGSFLRSTGTAAYLGWSAEL